MATLSTAAKKLLAYFGIYHITPSNYKLRISGGVLYENTYNINWFIGNMDSSDGSTARIPASPQTGLFKTALKELTDAGY